MQLGGCSWRESDEPNLRLVQTLSQVMDEGVLDGGIAKVAAVYGVRSKILKPVLCNLTGAGVLSSAFASSGAALITLSRQPCPPGSFAAIITLGRSIGA